MPKKKSTFFSELVDKYFDRLVTEYGFKKIESDTARGEHWVKFRNETTELTLYCVLLIHYEDPWIKITNLRVDRQSTLLEFLLHYLDVEYLPGFGQHPAQMDNIEDLEERIKQKSQQLFKYAKDLLKGNFSIMPKLKELEQKILKEREEYK